MRGNDQQPKFLDTLADLLHEKRFRVALVLSALGIIALVAAYFLEDSPGRLKISSFLLTSGGAALLITGVADFVLLEHSTRATRQETKKAIDDLRQDFKIVTESIKTGLIEVFPPRRSEENEPVNTAITNAIQEHGGMLKILGFSLREFLDGGQSFNRKLHDLLNSDVNVHVQLLLIDPFSDAARLRTVTEQGLGIVYEEGQLYTDTVASIRSLQSLVRESKMNKRFKIEARFYNCHPMFYMIATADSLLLEPYHVGRLAGDPSCIGGSVPILRFGGKSLMYERATAHFNYIWKSLKKKAAPSPQSKDAAEEPWSDGRYLVTRTLEEVVANLPIAHQT